MIKFDDKYSIYMSCGSCGSGGCSSDGCGQKGGCATGGCNKLNTYDWLGNMLPPNQTEVDNVYEVRFKNTRKEFFRNVNGLRLHTGDTVVVESDRGTDIGQLSLGGVLAELQLRKMQGQKKRSRKPDATKLPRIYRIANEEDVDLLKSLRPKEDGMRIKAREIVNSLGLNMKLSDVEYQGDGAKAIFYYIADARVDFRELIKLLAREFSIRVEMRQIGLRHEAGLIGGIGACGRELCCSTWLTDFKTVSTSAARYQNLSLNPTKISGLCGRLKCCLNFELETYQDALKGFPKADRIKTQNGTAFLQKTDIFKGMMWYSYPEETTWHSLSTDEVKAMLEDIKAGNLPESLSKITEAKKLEESAIDFVDVLDTELPTLPPKQKGGNRRNKNRRKPNQGGSQQRDKKGPSDRKRGGGRGKQDGNNQKGGDQKDGNQKRGPQNKAKSKPQNRRNKPKQDNPDAKSTPKNEQDNKNPNQRNRRRNKSRRGPRKPGDQPKNPNKDS
ncbi:MAG: regulatory iron-sulfur-containing complex subunit RicT [Bacteroidia bacterium]